MKPEFPSSPHCPVCGRVMKLARVMPRVGALCELRTFACRTCGTVLTEPVEDVLAQSFRAS